MIFIRSKILFFVFAILLLILTPMVFVPFINIPLEYLPFVFSLLLLELLIYLTYVRIGNWSVPLAPLFIYSLILVLSRAVLCGISMLLSHLVEFVTPAPSSFLLIWLGNPLSYIIQIVVLCLITPHLLIEFAPGLLGSELSEFMKEELNAIPYRSASPRTITSLTTPPPTTGLYNVYSFQELEAQLSKCIGLEGFIIFTDESVVLWQYLNLNIDAERLVVKLSLLGENIRKLTSSLGLAQTNKIFLETDEHFIVNGFIDSVMGYVLIFTPTMNIDEMFRRIEIISESVNVFLRTKYRTLITSKAER